MLRTAKAKEIKKKEKAFAVPSVLGASFFCEVVDLLPQATPNQFLHH
jgi:hypothetical protein